jgi:hypothetical protein
MYIYVRDHDGYQLDNVYKIGKTDDLENTHNEYVNSEFRPGFYVLVLQFENDNIDFEKILYKKFKHLHIYKNGGLGFYKREIKDQIVDYFNSIGFPFNIIIS